VLIAVQAPSRARRATPSPWRASWPWIGALGALLACLGLQSQLYSGQERTVTSVFMFVALAQAWNLIGGYTGYVSFGHVVFFGLGGYTTAVLITHLGLSFWMAMLVAGIAAAVFAGVIGSPLLRLRGHYFAIATLGVAEGMREVVTNLPSLTGGGAGITVPTAGPQAPTAYLGNDGFYLLFLALAAGSIAVTAVVSRSRFGYALRAIHQDEDAAGSMGINTTRTKLLVFMLSGFITGLVGAAYAFQQVAIFPARLFDSEITILTVIMVVLGGSGTLLGPVLGAVILQFISEGLRQQVPQWHTLILGVVVIAAVVLTPQGVVGFSREALRKRRISLLENVRRYRL
jgi:branched-chain amino acid transport system permease protein